MAKPAHIAAHDPDVETGPNAALTRHLPTPESDDEPIECRTANRRAVSTAGRLARAEQQRLEQQYQLANGRTPGPDRKPDPGGYFD
jgi:hypothetical protein